MPVIEKGEHLHLDFVKYRQTDKIIIHSSAKLHAHRDGEYFQADYFDIEILPIVEYTNALIIRKTTEQLT